MPVLPTGLVTFLFTDIEGSTRLWEHNPAQMTLALRRHDALLRDIVGRHDGHVFKTVGDAFCIAFDNASHAVDAATHAQLSLLAEAWPEDARLVVRMAVHTGDCVVHDDDYFGQTLNRAARLLAIAHGGQVLVSAATAAAVRDSLSRDVTLLDRGRHRLKDLAQAEHVFQVVHSGLPTAFPPLRSLSGHPNNLPHHLSTFVGRSNELRDVKALLGKTRLLTLSGAGGTGKTRLGLQAAAESLESYEDGVWIVELAALTDASLVAKTVASVLDVREVAGTTPLAGVAAHLRDKHAMLVLDNCEHLVDACAQLVDVLLTRCPHLYVVATSRQQLGITGEYVYKVPSLSAPDPRLVVRADDLVRYEAVSLFVERARVHMSDFAISDDTARAIASVCARLEGSPLAIELAAARIRSMSIREIDERLHQRFQLLTGGPRTALPRQQSLRSMLDWSYDLLTDREKALLCRTSVFAGGWTLPAAAAICSGDGIDEAEVLDLMTSLTDKSLVVADPRERGTRYRTLEMVREYTREHLATGQEQRLREKHLAYFVAFAAQANPRGADQQAWLDRLEAEHDNLRAALVDAGQTLDIRAARLRLAGNLWWFWLAHGHLGEGRRHLASALEATASDGASAARASALNGAAVLAFEQGDYDAARLLWEEAIAVSEAIGPEHGMTLALRGLAGLALIQGDYDRAEALYEKVLAVQKSGNDAGTLGNLGLVAHAKGDYAKARELHSRALAMHRQSGDTRSAAICLANLGIVLTDLGQHPDAKAMFEEGLALFEQTGDRRGAASTKCYMGNQACEMGDHRAARHLYQQSLAARFDLGDRLGVVEVLEGIACVQAGVADIDSAARLWGFSDRLRQELHTPMERAQRRRYDRAVTDARGTCGDEEIFDRAWRRGREMPLDQAIALALSAGK